VAILAAVVVAVVVVGRDDAWGHEVCLMAGGGRHYVRVGRHCNGDEKAVVVAATDAEDEEDGDERDC